MNENEQNNERVVNLAENRLSPEEPTIEEEATAEPTEEQVAEEPKKPRGRPRKSVESNAPKEKKEKKYDTFDGLPPLTPYRNVHPHMTIVLKVFGDEEEKADIVVRPGDEILLNEKDRRHYRNDVNFLKGDIIPDSPEIAASVTNKGSNIMTEQQIHYLVFNSKDANDLSDKIEEITSINTLRRIREECGLGRQDKPMSWTDMIDKHIKARHELKGGVVTAHDKHGHMEVTREGGIGKNT